MKLYLSILVVALLSGCYQVVNRSDIESAIIICARNKAEVVEIYANAAGGESVLCSNRITYPIQPELLKPAPQQL